MASNNEAPRKFYLGFFDDAIRNFLFQRLQQQEVPWDNISSSLDNINIQVSPCFPLQMEYSLIVDIFHSLRERTLSM